MKRELMSAKFKRDYVAYSAIGIFFAVVAAEFVLAIGIPLRINEPGLFEEQVSRQQMIDRFDSLRSLLERYPLKNEDCAEEGRLLRWNVDRLGYYLRDHVNALTESEIAALRERIDGQINAFHRLNKGRPYNREFDLDPVPYADRMAPRLEKIIRSKEFQP